ncbi:unnamed protein product [Penicillium salamii]|nr:unnamed protein product [Penicillium salamii]
MASPLQDSRSASAESTTEVTPFLTDPVEFHNDPRISWSKPDSCWILEREDGEEFHFDTSLKKWVLEVDPELIRQQQSAYVYHGVEENDTEVPHPRELKARQKAEMAAAPKPKKARVNTAVFVSKLPLDADKEEIRQLFVKYGVIAEEIDSGEPKIKMYKDQDGKFIGEALVVYFRPESILLATQMLDETEFRFGVTAPGGPMRVEVADTSYKRNESEAADRPKHSASDKRKIIERTQRLNSKLADWDDDAPTKRKFTRAEHNLVLKHMFDMKELADDPTDMIDISMEIREECEKFGEVTKVTIWDEEPEGVVTVRFKHPEHAIACMEKLQGRYFDKKAVEASISQSRHRFRKSGYRHGDDSDFSDGERERLDRYGDWLESQEEPKAKKAKTEDVRATEPETNDLGADKPEIDGL